MDNFLSTTKLAKALGISTKELFSKMADNELICRENGEWKLTKAGTDYGGKYKQSSKFGEYIVWPSNHLPDSKELVTVSELSKKLDCSPLMVNLVFQELNFIKKCKTGWTLTELGKSKHGNLKHKLKQNDKNVKATFVVWPRSIIEDQQVRNLTADLNNDSSSIDGHILKNTTEVSIDNFLYLNRIAHSYNHKLPEDDLKCTFYLPTLNLYVDVHNDIKDMSETDLAKLKIKQGVYKRLNLSVLEIYIGSNDIETVLSKQLNQYRKQM